MVMLIEGETVRSLPFGQSPLDYKSMVVSQSSSLKCDTWHLSWQQCDMKSEYNAQYGFVGNLK